MLRFLLDTDTAIELQHRRDPELSARFAEHASELALSATSAFELWHGAERSSNPTQNRHATDEFLSLFALVNFDLDAASHAAEMRAELTASGTPIGAYDLQIAAIARARGMTVITGNTREFARVPGLRTVDWLHR
ncbi:MAG: type II toxin-antitoxin system VapC family toxin [Leucobacter sp.]